MENTNATETKCEVAKMFEDITRVVWVATQSAVNGAEIKIDGDRWKVVTAYNLMREL